MKPDRRLDQLEPLMADSLQKIDRLIEGQGQLAELAVKTKAELDQVKKTGEVTANGLANLTTYVQQGFAEVKSSIVNMQGDITNMQENIANIQAGQSLILQILRERLP
ncbi:hypothetical protein [Spirosoma foliorum]|uniref:Uncharacterized protein n=1 Tax=Spirosoma foliorum TaxID=2710596 RepID=A0A7G5GQC0_9BACT|nr:hypothetical protein [Spirosoma foliorum]QMW01062.1 hypothetical protein H3H32_24230 [Spirosoma foliorum]